MRSTPQPSPASEGQEIRGPGASPTPSMTARGGDALPRYVAPRWDRPARTDGVPADGGLHQGLSHPNDRCRRPSVSVRPIVGLHHRSHALQGERACSLAVDSGSARLTVMVLRQSGVPGVSTTAGSACVSPAPVAKRPRRRRHTDFPLIATRPSRLEAPDAPATQPGTLVACVLQSHALLRIAPPSRPPGPHGRSSRGPRRARRRQSAGGTWKSRLKARPKAASESYPARSATAFSGALLLLSSRAPSCSRHRAR